MQLKRILWRKLIVSTIITALIALFLIGMALIPPVDFSTDSIIFIVLLIAFTFLGAIAVGISISFISDYITKRLSGYLRMAAAFVVHAGFGYLVASVFGIGEAFYMALMFGVLDEFVRWMESKGYIKL
ncbi:hypothetical protein CR205_12085 [Alteribacter lacisalsi]|uniref:Uncharacterized protein n=1 Tax=Alteribacter lacisalsi TaxID=2045244 RepID=A0A2W0H3Q1_9BACI|nr:hypothetical protein [Alteribacter lacisalsi]PYZ96454.1 hypothetical protein CR205_12085 [Alteribacter lacisalsi]